VCFKNISLKSEQNFSEVIFLNLKNYSKLNYDYKVTKTNYYISAQFFNNL